MHQELKLLFICSRNQWRSPTAEKVFHQQGYNARSAGTSPSARKTVSVDDIQWASHVFVMEEKHKSRLVAKFTRLLQYKKPIVLDIPDEYRFMDEELITLLNDGVPVYLD